MRAVLQNHVRTTSISSLKKHWFEWHNNYSDEKKERIEVEQRNVLNMLWQRYVDSENGFGFRPSQYRTGSIFG